MADSSLDDFFAKKNKGKKGKYTTTNTIVKKLEENSKRSGNEPIIKREKEKPSPTLNNSVPTVPLPILEQEADDWKDVEEEKEKDYTGLRIQALTMTEREEGEEEGQAGSGDEDGEEGSGSGGKGSSDTSSGPWKLNSTPCDSPPPPVTVEPPKVATYRPPSAARMAARSRGSGKVAAPEINSELHFPSLSSSTAAADATAKETGGRFQSVRHGARSKPSSAAPHIDLENKFAALHHQ